MIVLCRSTFGLFCAQKKPASLWLCHTNSITFPNPASVLTISKLSYRPFPWSTASGFAHPPPPIPTLLGVSRRDRGPPVPQGLLLSGPFGTSPPITGYYMQFLWEYRSTQCNVYTIFIRNLPWFIVPRFADFPMTIVACGHTLVIYCTRASTALGYVLGNIHFIGWIEAQ
jgi:hypothetical protein